MASRNLAMIIIMLVRKRENATSYCEHDIILSTNSTKSFGVVKLITHHLETNITHVQNSAESAIIWGNLFKHLAKSKHLGP
jgi:hypothetical protein